MKTNKLISVAAMASAAMLAGCGESAPGDADVRAAMERQIVQVAGKEGAESQKGELSKIRVGKCVAAELGGFQCEFAAGGATRTGRFKKGEKGWELVGVGG